MNAADDIKRLHELHQAGALTDSEFSQAKAALLEKLNRGPSKSDSSSHFVQAVNHFRRSRTDRWFGGICGGLSETTGIESWIWRLLFVFSAFFFMGFLIYVLAWIFVPSEE